MSCMNCNRETSGANVFCEECLQAMEQYPVEKGTPIVIPHQPSPAAPKKQGTHRYASAEEQLNAARRTNRRLGFGLTFISILLILTIAALVYILLFGVPDFVFDITTSILTA